MKVAIELKLKDEFTKGIKDASGITVDFGEELKELLAATKASSLGADRLGDAVTSLGAGLQGLVAHTQHSSDTTNALSDVIASLSSEMAQSRQVTAALAYSIGAMGEKSKPAEKQLSQFKQTIQEIGKAWASARKASAQMMHIADGAGRFAAQGRGVIQSLVGESIELENALARVGAKTGTTGTAEWQELADQARELGKTTTFTALEVAGAQDFLAQAGLKANEVLAATPGMLNLSRVGALDLASAADIATNVLQGMGMGIEETGRAVDVLAKAAVTSNTSVQQMGTAMAYAAPGAAAMGISIEETAAAIGALSDAGIGGSKAGTSMRKIFASLVPTSKAAQKQFKKLGIQVTDEAGNFRNFVDIIEDFARATESLSPEEQVRFRQQIFGTTGATPIGVLMDAARSGKLRDSSNMLAGAEGEAARLADEMIGPTQRAIVELQSAWAGLKDDLSQAFLPLLRDMMDGLKPIIASLSEWVKENPALAAGLAEAAVKIVAVTTVVSPLLQAMSLLRLAMVGPKGIAKAATMTATALEAAQLKAAGKTGVKGVASRAGVLLGKAGLVAGAGYAGYKVGGMISRATGLEGAIKGAISDRFDRKNRTYAGPALSRDEAQNARIYGDGSAWTADGRLLRLGKEGVGGASPKLLREAYRAGHTDVDAINKFIESRRAADAEGASIADASVMLGELLTQMRDGSREGGEVDVTIKVESEGGAKVTATRTRSSGVANGEVVMGAF